MPTPRDWVTRRGETAPSTAAGESTGRRATDLATSLAHSLAGGRVSVDTPYSGFLAGLNVILPPNEAEDQWRWNSLDTSTLDRVSPSRLLQLMADLSPEIARALWDFLRLCNPGYEFTVMRPGTETEDTRGKAVVQEFVDLLSDRYGSFDVIIGRLFMGPFTRGAFLAELILDEAGRMPVDFATPDPATVRFRRATDPVRGQVWEMGQYQGTAAFVPITRPTVRYVPVDPFPGSPYGRSMASPALFTALFLLGLLHDLRRVIAQQGYPRLDVAIDFDKMQAAMPDSLRRDPAAVKAWMDAALGDVQSVYRGLKPDDAYIHPSIISVNRPVGTVDSSSLGAIDGIIKALERMSVRALKTMPLMMGAETSNESAANRQWEVQAAGIKSIQHLAETLLGRLFGLALQAQGILATVTFRFAELRASEMLRDAQTEAIRIANATAKYAAGYTSQDEAAQEITGHDADVPEPRALPHVDTPVTDSTVVDETATAGDTASDPGANK